jgi:hypothetical protein
VPDPEPDPEPEPEPASAGPEPAVAGAPEPPAASGKLRLTPLRLAAGDAPGQVRYQFAVAHANAGRGAVTGTIWIAVNGLVDGRPTRLSLRRISEEKSSFVTLDFDREQQVAGELTLPGDFTPKSMLVEVKPAEERFSEVAETFDWELEPAPESP